MQIIIIITLLASLAQAAADFKKDCVLAMNHQNDPEPGNRVNIVDWVKDQAAQIGFTPSWEDKENFAINLGDRNFIIGMQGSFENCEVIGFMLDSLKKLKTVNPKPAGIVVFFGKNIDAFKKEFKTRIWLKEYDLTEEAVKKDHSRIYSEVVKFDHDPKKAIEITGIIKSLGQIKTDLKSVIDENDFKAFKKSLNDIQSQSKTWAADKLYEVRGKLNQIDEKRVAALNQKVRDLEVHIAMYDQVRRGLWDKANESLQKISTPSPKLKAAMEKGRNNIEEILKTIKADTHELEKEIVRSFTECKTIVENELKESK